MQHQEGQGHESLAFFFLCTSAERTFCIWRVRLTRSQLSIQPMPLPHFRSNANSLLSNARKRFFRRSHNARKIVFVRMALRLVPIVN